MLQVTDLFHKLVAKLTTWLEQLVIMLPNLGLALLILALGALASNVMKGVVYRVLISITRNGTISQLASTLARVLALLVTTFFALGVLNLDKTVTSLLAGVGVVGLALGFAF